MNFQELLQTSAESGHTTRAALIGVGQFGRTLLSQSRRIPDLELAALCDLDLDRMTRACEAAGLTTEDYRIADSEPQALRAFESGKTVLTQDPAIAIGLPVDIVVEATGNPEAGARNAISAIDQGRHLAMVTKETDGCIGPLLSHRARRQGRVVTQVDGDQPSLLLGLISWARTLGLEIVSAGKASEFDFVFDAGRSEVRAEVLDVAVTVDPAIWNDTSGRAGERARLRARLLDAIPQRTPPDFCEMCLVANGSGLKPDCPDLHAAIAKPLELPELYIPEAEGGMLESRGALDIFNCFRRPEDISFAGGVFAVLEVPDTETGALFRRKGMPTSRDGRYVLVYNPTHLLGVEAPFSMLVAHRLGMATGSSTVRPVCDVGMRAREDLDAGAVLADQGYHHRIAGVEPVLLDHGRLSGSAALPYFMGIDRTLVRAIKKGDIIPVDAIARPADSVLWRLRGEQDRLFDGS